MKIAFAIEKGHFFDKETEVNVLEP
jgi:hypothetical protein